MTMKPRLASGDIWLADIVSDPSSDVLGRSGCARSERSRAANAVRFVNDNSPARKRASMVALRVADPVIEHLERALMRALERPVSSAFVDHVSLAMLAHLAHSYGVSAAPETVHRGGLSAKQARKAKEYLAGHFSEDVLSADVAAACGLSRDHFVRAFRRTTGVTPRRWLQKYRVEKAKEMLLSSKFAIAEIAVRCGFADQSHLTRVFKVLEGTSPAVWRRQHAAD
jgi:AraC family transcriptional regulator